jgi:mannose/cellobiose epimerase-like protein (N-acyl-D-glucosamine 2-epimerase family)
MTESIYTFGTPEHQQFLADQTRELLEFGKRFPWPGGGASYLRDDGSPWPGQGLEAYETGRFAHAYALGSFLSIPSKDEARRLCVASLLGFTTGALHDRRHGGWYTSVLASGTPQEGKACYAHAFVLLGASSALLAHVPGAKALLDDALDIYERHFWDAAEHMPFDTWDTSFETLDDYRGVNASMHSVEAFLAVSDATDDPLYRNRAGAIINRVLNFARTMHWRIPEHFDSQWTPAPEYNADRKQDQFKPYGSTPGHGLEWARLIAQWALNAYAHHEISLTQRDEYVQSCEHLFERAVADGWNADGQPGFIYTVGWDGSPVIHDRMHWTLAEGINTTAVLYRLTGKEQYAEFYATLWRYADQYVIDHKQGSWHHQLDANNRPIGTVWPGKPDIYHALQATLIPTFDTPELGTSIATVLSRR